LGDRLGTKRVFVASIALFTIASGLCGLAPNFPALVGFRILQGLAGGMMMPVGTAILYRTFPPAERISVSRILMIPTVVAPTSGPILGGFLVVNFSWHWAFFINVPIGLIATLFGFFFLREHREQKAGHFDLPGFFFAGGGLALVMYALNNGSILGWVAPLTWGPFLLGAAFLVLFVWLELRTREPMVDLRLFADRIFRTTNLLSFFATAGFLGLLFLAPLFLQEVTHATAFVAGLTTSPEAIGVLIASQLVAYLYPKIGAKRTMSIGLVIAAVFTGLLLLMQKDTDLWWMRALMFIIGGGMSFIFVPIQAVAFSNISSSAMGRASALFSAQRQLGGAVGVAVLSTALNIIGPVSNNAAGVTEANITAYHIAFLISASLLVVAAIWAMTVRDNDMKEVGIEQTENEEVLSLELG
jgi:EmrB/QacA subfamily drug resistance transporter